MRTFSNVVVSNYRTNWRMIFYQTFVVDFSMLQNLKLEQLLLR